ncbi:MAG: Sua5/YciO/YrdC/YwlC family protein, partial [Bacilli bacterium]|nr:Sua5/YciO/YrdC/YwlC family protein [Bacilli bacterium]
YWPGPLTIILQGNNEKLSFRMPDCPPALKIINHLGLMATTSVNESGEQELNDYQEIKDRFGQAIDYFIVDRWRFSGISSTVVDVSKNQIEIIRQGSIKL